MLRYGHPLPTPLTLNWKNEVIELIVGRYHSKPAQWWSALSAALFSGAVGLNPGRAEPQPDSADIQFFALGVVSGAWFRCLRCSLKPAGRICSTATEQKIYDGYW